MAKFRNTLQIARLVTALLGFGAFLLTVIAVVIVQFLPPNWAWLPAWPVRVFVAITLVNVGLAISLAVLRGISAKES